MCTSTRRNIFEFVMVILAVAMGMWFAAVAMPDWIDTNFKDDKSFLVHELIVDGVPIVLIVHR